MKTKPLMALVAFVCLMVACSGIKDTVLDGHWRASWASSGGEIPVDLYLTTDSSGRLDAEVRNDTEVVQFSRVERSGNHIDFFIDRYESAINAVLTDDGKTMSGQWSKQTGTPNQMKFIAQKGELERFPLQTYPGLSRKVPFEDLSGIWKLQFEGDNYDSVGLFKQQGERLTGTIRAVDGDFRYLEGVYRNGLLLLSSFNGTWVFLFRAEMDSQGVLHGFWARGPREPVKWTATREEPDYPDSFSVTRLSNSEGRLRFRYPSANDPQRFVSNEDPEFQGQPLLAAFLLSGCPNSHDCGALLSQLYRDYHPRGLNVVLIFCELTKDLDQIQARVQRFMKEYGLASPALYSTAMSKKETAEEMPDFQAFLAWPTVVLYNASGKVDFIQTGIDGPATGEHYRTLICEYRERIERLLSPQGE
jgi:hypothetical protein